MSNIKDYSKATWDDIVFEDLNKDYGAYILRKLVNKNTLKAFLITSGVFVVLVLAAQLKVFQQLGKKNEKEVKLEMTEVNIEEPPPVVNEPPPPPPPPPPVRPTIKLVELVAKKDELVQEEEPITKQDEVKNTQVSNENIKGDPNAKPKLDPPKEEGGKGPETVTPPPPPPPKEPEIFEMAEVQPSFPGGPTELMKYLNKNINYPNLARENGLEGKVFIKFYVDTDGTIRDAKVVKDGVGGGCAEEAKRVVNSMPKWNPGLQRGKPVKVYYTLPVTFKLN